MEQRHFVASAVAMGLCVAIGMIAGGWTVAKGLTRFRSETRVVTVKGLVEREVESDQAAWLLSFRRAGEQLAEVNPKILADREAVGRFLAKRGFTAGEIETLPSRTLDKQAQDYGGNAKATLRYVVTGAVLVRTVDVEKLKSALASTDELSSAGVILDAGTEGRANPRFTYSRFNMLRPQLLADATRNARATARQFAADSGSVVGRIHSANQGNIQIFGSDGSDESGPFSPTSTQRKRIRVVSTFEFELE